jgi:hypothetical protein
MVIPILAFANGTLPYLEVRTAGSWNMYANLSVVDGNSNHFVIRWGLPLTEEHRDLVEIMAPVTRAWSNTRFKAWPSPVPSYAATWLTIPMWRSPTATRAA